MVGNVPPPTPTKEPAVTDPPIKTFPVTERAGNGKFPESKRSILLKL
jgi:hypothetical protein